MNGRICFVCFFTLHGKQIKFIRLFLGESRARQSAFWFYLTFTYLVDLSSQVMIIGSHNRVNNFMSFSLQHWEYCIKLTSKYNTLSGMQAQSLKKGSRPHNKWPLGVQTLQVWDCIGSKNFPHIFCGFYQSLPNLRLANFLSMKRESQSLQTTILLI